MSQRKLLFSLTAKDFEWSYYNGTGNGGQNRNKTQACVRCTHPPSGSVGKCEEERSQSANKQRAFERCIATKEFKKWHKFECARRMGVEAAAQTAANAAMLETRIETKDENGRWQQADELKVTEQDIKYLAQDAGE